MCGRIRRRTRFFVGCEGESEQGYAALLQRFASERDVAVHVDAKVITRAGDPLSLIRRASVLAAQGERRSSSAYRKRFLMLDKDLMGQDSNRDNKVFKLATENNICLLWQDCCFEAFLLRHFNGHYNDVPATAALALDRLRAVWPEYRKGLSSRELHNHITLEHVQRAAKNCHNNDFLFLIDELGLSLD